MKKFIILLIAVVLILCIVACSSKKNQDNVTDVAPSDVVEEQKDDDTTTAEPVKEDTEEAFKATESMIVESNGTAKFVFVDFMDVGGPSRGTGVLAIQSNRSVMILDSQYLSSPEVASGKIEDIFPTYFSQTEAIVEAQYIGDRLNFAFEVESKENVEINGYEMCKFTGTHTYETYLEDGTFSQKFVAYATKTKGNDGFVYWMVLDGTEDGSLEDELDELGEKMAYSFREE